MLIYQVVESLIVLRKVFIELLQLKEGVSYFFKLLMIFGFYHRRLDQKELLVKGLLLLDEFLLQNLYLRLYHHELLEVLWQEMLQQYLFDLDPSFVFINKGCIVDSGFDQIAFIHVEELILLEDDCGWYAKGLIFIEDIANLSYVSTGAEFV